MLKDEIKPNHEPLPTHENPLRKTLETDIEAFLSAGGKIQPVESRPVNQRGIFNPSIVIGDADNIHLFPAKNRAKVKARSGRQNILIAKAGWRVCISKEDCGTYPTIDEAVEVRDRKRAALGLPPADY